MSMVVTCLAAILLFSLSSLASDYILVLLSVTSLLNQANPQSTDFDIFLKLFIALCIFSMSEVFLLFFCNA